MKRSEILYGLLILSICLSTALQAGTPAIVSIDWVDRERSLEHVHLVAIGDTELVVIERLGTARIERHMDHSRIRRIQFELSPYCETAVGHYNSGDATAAFERWERIWKDWQAAAERGWVDPQWKSAWWEVLQRSYQSRSHLDTLLFAESFVRWFGTDRNYRMRLYRLIAKTLIGLDQQDSALPYLETIAIDTFPHPPEGLHALRFQIVFDDGKRQSALDAWLDDCVLTGTCEPVTIQTLLDDWDAHPEWRELEPPQPIHLNDRDNTSFDHAP